MLLVAAGGPWAAPVELTIDAHRISVRQRGAATAPERSPGWLIDLGERAKDQPPAQTLQLQWPQGAEFRTAECRARCHLHIKFPAPSLW